MQLGVEIHPLGERVQIEGVITMRVGFVEKMVDFQHVDTIGSREHLQSVGAPVGQRTDMVGMLLERLFAMGGQGVVVKCRCVGLEAVVCSEDGHVCPKDQDETVISSMIDKDAVEQIATGDGLGDAFKDVEAFIEMRRIGYLPKQLLFSCGTRSHTCCFLATVLTIEPAPTPGIVKDRVEQDFFFLF